MAHGAGTPVTADSNLTLADRAGDVVFDRIRAAVEAAPERAAITVRTISARTAAGVRSAPMRAAAFGAAPAQLVAGANTLAELGWAAVPTADGVNRRPTPAGIAMSGGAALPATVTGHGWRHATSDRAAHSTARQASRPAGRELSGPTVVTTQPGSPMSAASGPAGIAATGLLGLPGLLLLLLLASQRLGPIVWLRPASAPASPFLALPERPG